MTDVEVKFDAEEEMYSFDVPGSGTTIHLAAGEHIMIPTAHYRMLKDYYDWVDADRKAFENSWLFRMARKLNSWGLLNGNTRRSRKT